MTSGATSRVAAADLPADFPAWAYPLTPPMPARPPDDGKLLSMPGSTQTFTVSQLRDRNHAPDWHPEDHPAMPKVVAFGRKPDVLACAYCHRPNGGGGPENASLAGLPAQYIAQQIRDMASGARSTVLPTRGPHITKQSFVRNVTEAELETAARYFSSLKPVENIVVKEAAMVPTLRPQNFFFAATEDGATEPIGQRIVEIPETLHDFEVFRDDRVRFIAYVPPGSIAAGAARAALKNKETGLTCAGCHGNDLHGQGAIPRLAGRSPSYLVRQLYDMRQGARHGEGAALMRPVVAEMSTQDMISLAAYLASLKP